MDRDGRRRGARAFETRFVAFLCALGALACPRAEQPTRPNVLLVVLDTVRADELGCLGNSRGTTPHLDQVATDGALFTQATSHAPWTLPASASLFTSLLPTQHGAGGHLPNLTRLDEHVPTLAERFRDAGYATAEIVNVGFLAEPFGLTRGFEHVDAVAFENNDEVRRADETTTRALDWLRGREDKPFFLLVHYFDAHARYDPPQPYRRRFARPEDAEGGEFAFGSREDMVRLRSGGAAPSRETIERAHALYDGEVAFVDAEVGRLLDGARELGLDASTVLAVTADHGEEFLDHGGFEHGHTHYAELLHVPLILRGPGVPRGWTSDANVGLIDIAPTLLALARIERPRSFEGQSLIPMFQGEALTPRALLAYGNFWDAPLASLRTDESKLIVYPAGSKRASELYRWREDAGELHDRASAHPPAREALEKLLAHTLQVLASRTSAGGKRVDLDLEAQRALDELGYSSRDSR